MPLLGVGSTHPAESEGVSPRQAQNPVAVSYLAGGVHNIQVKDHALDFHIASICADNCGLVGFREFSPNHSLGERRLPCNVGVANAGSPSSADEL